LGCRNRQQLRKDVFLLEKYRFFRFSVSVNYFL